MGRLFAVCQCQRQTQRRTQWQTQWQTKRQASRPNPAGKGPLHLAAMTDLNALLAAGTRENVVSELTGLADKTVSSQSGLTGMALKSAVAAGKKANPNAVSDGVDQALPQLVAELQPYFSRYESGNAANFGAFLSSRSAEVVEKILAAADGATDQMPAPARTAYFSLRGKAGDIITPALPEFGQIIERHL